MTPTALAIPVGLVLGGVPGALVGVLGALAWRRRRKSKEPPRPRLVMMLLLVELGSGASVLAALQRTSDRLPEHGELHLVARVATVSGLTAAIGRATTLRPIISQLARAQRSGAPLASSVRRLLESDISAERTRRLSRAKSLPVRLMVPVSLLMLPGVILLLYAPSLIQTFDQLAGVWS